MDQGPGGSALLYRARRFYVILMVIIVLSLFLQVAGFVSPGWSVVKFAESDIHVGLWYARFCFAGRCTTKTLESDSSDNRLTEYRAETSLAIGFIIIAIILERLTQQRFRCACIGVILLTLISGILALVAAGKHADMIRKAYFQWKLYSRGEDSPFGFPYSVFLTGLGGIFACVAMIVGVFGLKSSAIYNSVPPPLAYHMMLEPPPLFTVQENVAYPYQSQSHLAQQNAAQNEYTAYLEKGDLSETNVQPIAPETRY